jgi:hypothetical protein
LALGSVRRLPNCNDDCHDKLAADQKNMVAMADLKKIIRSQYGSIRMMNPFKEFDVLDKIGNEYKDIINETGEKYGIPSEIIGSIIIKEQFTKSLPDTLVMAHTLKTGVTHSVGLGAIFPDTARTAWYKQNIAEAYMKEIHEMSDVELQTKLYLNDNFNIETIGVVLVDFAKDIYGKNTEVSQLTNDQLKTVVGRYNAIDQKKQKGYSDKVFEYLDPVRELLN